MNLEQLQKKKEGIVNKLEDLDKSIQDYVNAEVEKICKKNKMNFESGMGGWFCETEVLWNYGSDYPEGNGYRMFSLEDNFECTVANYYAWRKEEDQVEDAIQRLVGQDRDCIAKEDLDRLVDCYLSFKQLIKEIGDLGDHRLLDLRDYLAKANTFTFSKESKI